MYISTREPDFTTVLKKKREEDSSTHEARNSSPRAEEIYVNSPKSPAPQTIYIRQAGAPSCPSTRPRPPARPQTQPRTRPLIGGEMHFRGRWCPSEGSARQLKGRFAAMVPFRSSAHGGRMRHILTCGGGARLDFHEPGDRRGLVASRKAWFYIRCALDGQ